MSCSTLSCAQFLFFSISPWLPSLDIFQGLNAFIETAEKGFLEVCACHACMCVSSLGRRQIPDFIISLRLPCLRFLPGRGAHVRPLSVVLKRRGWERALQIAHGTIYQGSPVVREGLSLVLDPVLLWDCKWQSWEFSQNRHVSPLSQKKTSTQHSEVIPCFLVWHQCSLLKPLQVSVFTMCVTLLRSVSYFSRRWESRKMYTEDMGQKMKTRQLWWEGASRGERTHRQLCRNKANVPVV